MVVVAAVVVVTSSYFCSCLYGVGYSFEMFVFKIEFEMYSPVISSKCVPSCSVFHPTQFIFDRGFAGRVNISCIIISFFILARQNSGFKTWAISRWV